MKVLDFGLAKAMERGHGASVDVVVPISPHPPRSRSTATTRASILGTAAYMSPEQARGQAGRQAQPTSGRSASCCSRC